MIKELFSLCNISINKVFLKQLKCVGFMVIYTVLTIVFPSYIGKIVDVKMDNEYYSQMFYYISQMFFVGMLMILFQYLQNISFYKLAQELIVKIKNSIYAKLFDMDLTFHDTHKNGDIFTIIQSDVASLEKIITSTISDLFINFFMVVGILIYIFIVDWMIGLITLCITILLVIVHKKIGKIVENGMITLRISIGEFSSFVNETINNLVNIQLIGNEKRVITRFADKNKQVSQKSISQMRVLSSSGMLGLIFNVLGTTAILGVGVFKVSSGDISIGVLFNLLIYVQRVYSPILIAGNAYVSIKNVKPNLKKILEILKCNQIIEAGDCKPKYNLKGEIEFKDVSFSYNENLVFSKFNLLIKPHEIVGLVGKNGSGKTTITYLLGRLCKPDEGQILLDSCEICKYDTDFIKSQIGFMPQKSFILSGRLRDAIIPEGKTLDDEQIYRLLSLFKFDLDQFHSGLDTILGENLYNLSGGEAQKLSLIRLLLENKPIYILDEPTSALDLEAEKDICNIIKKYFTEHTVIIITHRERIKDICTTIIDLNKK
jgi:ABC-type multidrug transport system fused ATPase/permease subunit